MARLFLIDGMSHLYRAYYAIKGLTNKHGMSTNALYGFTTMVRKLMADEKPEYLGVAMDLAGPTVRHEQYAEYKATRPRMPEDLVEQMPFVEKLCKAFRLPFLSLEGYEADDVIGTLSRKAVQAGLDVVIVTVDKDMYQLVDEHVSVLDPRTSTLLDPSGVEAKWGVRPDQIVDVLSLIGDSSDNIPGAPGIGEKGAKGLIAEYGSLDALFERSEEVSRKSYRTSLQENEALIRRSRELILIHRELDLDLDLAELEVCEPDLAGLRTLFTELNFTNLLNEFLPQPETPQLTLRRIKNVGELDRLGASLAGKRVAVSVWADESDPLFGTPKGIALAQGASEAWFLPHDFLDSHPSETGNLFTTGAEWIFHDSKPFLLWAEGLGWELGGSLADTMLMGYLIDPNKNDFAFEKMCLEFLGLKLGGMSNEPSLLGDDKPVHLCERAVALLSLYSLLEGKVAELKLGRVLGEIELPLVSVLARMERTGVRVDTQFLQAMSEELEKEIGQIATRIYALAGEEFNLNSPKQLAEILFEKLSLPSAKKKGKAGHFSTSVEVLEELAVHFDIAQLILDYRELAKLKNTYLDALPRLVHQKTKRIHTSYNQTVASTGRLSSSNPNLQNIPIRSDLGRKVRKAFIPQEGFSILAADYSQIELRVMAHLSQDPVLLEAFQQGEDIHDRTAREVFGESSGLDARELRRRAKVINFGIMYGLSAFGLAKSLKIGRAEAQQFIDDYFLKYQGVSAWTERTVSQAQDDGFVQTLFGRIRQIPEIQSKNWNLREFARRTAVNAPIQGTAADLIKVAMVAIHERLEREGLQSRIILQVHDELVFEVHGSEVDYMRRLVREEMEGAAALDVPLKVDLAVGASWYEAK